MRTIAKVFTWIKKLFLREKKQPVSAAIQVVNSNITINIIRKD